jgi:tetratricopeptide (TPR) repeat protein
MRTICTILFMAALCAATTSALRAEPRLYRGGIAYNDYGHGPSGGYGYGRGAHTRGDNHYHGWSGGYGGYGNGGYNGGVGYSAYRPYFNNWSGNVGNVYLGVGSRYGYSSFGYYNGLAGGLYYNPYASDYGLYGTYYNPSYNYVEYYLPSTYQPAELAFGPQAVKQFMGVDRNFALGPLQNAPRVVEREVIREAAKPVVKEIDWDARQKADRYIELGDNFFKQQKFHDALLRYRLAIGASPEYAVAHLRHGFSLVANRRYEEAAVALTKAFTLDPQLPRSGFRVDQLYADNRMAREAHEEALAQATLDEPANGNLHFVVGMWLVFNGQPERSRKFFEKAKALGVEAAAAGKPVAAE